MNYEALLFKPLINGITVVGDRMFSDYGLIPISSDEVAEVMLECFGYLL